MFVSKDFANEFLKYLKGRHNSMKCTIEFEQAEDIPFLDILESILSARYPIDASVFAPPLRCRGSQKAFAAKWLPSGYHHF